MEPPAGVWESVQSAAGSGSGTGSGGGSGMNTLQKISRFILEQAGWKAALGVVGLIGGMYLISEFIEKPVQEPAATTSTEMDGKRNQGEVKDEAYPGTAITRLSETFPTKAESKTDERNETGQVSGEPSKTSEKSKITQVSSVDPGIEKPTTVISPVPTEKPTSAPEFSEEKEITCHFTLYTLKSKDGKTLSWYVDGNLRAKAETLVVKSGKDQILRVWAKDAQGRTSAEHLLKHESRSGISLSTNYLGGNTYQLTAETPEFEMLAWNLSEDLEPIFNHTQVTHTFVRREQPYTISLVVVYANGCADTLQQEIKAVDPDKYRNPVIPNIFTPYALDGLNDDFRIEMDEPEYFQLVIRDLKGQVVFESSDFQEAWNGKLRNSGELCPKGKYYYTLVYRMSGMSAQSRQNTLLLN